ncbi:putative Phytocyanin domain, cupredoxin [Arabidopsis thaliana]|uniref:ENODL20 n=2 Tax=Arabidopsis TaxID=3701 RepID=A0A178W0A5_ARATH|nr:Phytocyanin domain [Arabidopsis thaliana x Arabidopsis arenosa]OAP11638.1 ENODL20 [Arabidopsis thaliana]
MMGKYLWALIYVTVMILIVVEVESSLHRVGGGRYTWNSDVNFSDWANNQRFYSGDWLYFGFNRTRHNILQVNKSSYEQCVDNDYIFNITRGGRDVFQLLEPKPYYFICGRGYCLKGMKLAITVLPQPPPSAPTNFTSTTTPLIPPNAITAAILIFAFKALLL